ncbi:MAG: hypothetical protein E4G96_00385 [Chrysiogenales bacterium]|nr:MAG: hypothetical protein E4G96_00385 [Chrysiogenales bacterium]
MKVYPISAILMVSIFAMPLFSGAYEPDRLRVNIRMDKKVFFSDESVLLRICVTNMSDKKNYFEVYDPSGGESSGYTTFQPKVYDMMGRDAKITVPHRIEGRGTADLIRGLEKRIIELAPGEMFIHNVDLREIYDINLDSTYRVRSLFFPSFDQDLVLTSDNELSFRMIEDKRYRKPSEVSSIERSLSPKEVIMLTLRAEKDREWDNWIKFINVEKYINAFPEFVQKYYRADYQEKAEIEKAFIKFVTRERDDYLVDFSIIKESIEKERSIAYVDVVVSRFGIRWIHRFKSRYTLERYNNLWLITDEEATVMKGVKR